MYRSGFLRRSELGLRARFPHLTTTIYQLTEDSYAIYSEDFGDDFDIINDIFDQTIRFVTTPVKLTKNIPEQFRQILPGIDDNDIAKNFEGLAMNLVQIFNLMVIKFPDIPFSSIEERGHGLIVIYLKEVILQEGSTKKYIYPTPEKLKNLRDFLDGLKFDLEYLIVDEDKETPSAGVLEMKQKANYNISQLRRAEQPEFEKRDEALWFDNIDGAFQGTFRKKDLFFYNGGDYACYVDYSIFDGIDLRNHLFLFQKIYFTPPEKGDFKHWLKGKNITVNEFLELIVRGRIRIVLKEHSSKYDQGFLRSVYDAFPEGIISSRALALLQQTDLIETADNYIFNDIALLKELKKFSEIVGPIGRVDPRTMYDFLTWPMRAKTSAFSSLNTGDLRAIPAFGINRTVDKAVGKVVNKDLELEFMVSAPAVHISSSLNATYFPFKDLTGFSDYQYANLMGEMMNFYRSANQKTIKDYLENHNRRQKGFKPINPIEIIKLNNFISITELEDELSKQVIYPGSARLMEHLSGLSDSERKEKIKSYNQEIKKRLNKKRKSAGIIDLGSNMGLDAAGVITGIPILGTAFSVLKFGGKKVANIPFVHKLIEKINTSTHDIDAQNIHYLTKINRVARLDVKEED